MTAPRVDEHAGRVVSLLILGLSLIGLGKLLRHVDDNLAHLDD